VFSSGRPASRRTFSHWVLVAVATAAAVFGGSVNAKEAAAEKGLATLSEAALPPQARQTLQLIYSGGPFPYSKDGTVFGNRERLLPARSRGYYREYTVPTPASRDRGARRIVCGGPQPKSPEACYYSADHYASFHSIAR